jgi:NAD(P)-dependent dehydrogenase (short-subunit alcohol dehydrogenase family)
MDKSKIVLVTGGSSGIGFAVAQRFIKEKYHAIITGRNAQKLEDAVQILGENCVGIQFDLSAINEIPEFVQNIKNTYGRIDVLINNAGINQKKPFVEVTNEDFVNIVRTNQTSVFILSREVVKIMLNQESRGAIINISSMAVHYGLPKVISYTASKSALEGMTRAMAVELSPLGIRVNCVAPGFIETAMTRKAFQNDPERKDKVLARTPMEKLGTPLETANAVYFLASEEASFITGETLKVDGGNSIGF